ncbi:hypothetical protein MKW94_009812, partial [Papaver nudicaule]|nr:hypothetical protein [Papaver nudicaule]
MVGSVGAELEVSPSIVEMNGKADMNGKVEPLPEEIVPIVLAEDGVKDEKKVVREIVLGRNVHTMSHAVTEPEDDDEITGLLFGFRSLLCRHLPQDIGICTCVIVKETTPLEGFSGGSFYSLYTNEGQGRQDRKLAIAHHRRRNGKTEFCIAQNAKGLLCRSDDSFLGNVNADFMGSKYQIWDKGNPLDSLKQQSKLLLAVV